MLYQLCSIASGFCFIIYSLLFFHLEHTLCYWIFWIPMDRIWCLQFFGMFIEHLSSCHRRNNNIHLFVSLRTCAVAFCDFQASLFFFWYSPEARSTSNTVLWSHSTETGSQRADFLNISSVPFTTWDKAPKKRENRERANFCGRLWGGGVGSGLMAATNRLLIACTGVQSKNVHYQW